MGSPGFTAPERIRGGDATPASDLWSLGATLYAAVEGRGPYEQRGGAITTMSAIINEDATDRGPRRAARPGHRGAAAPRAVREAVRADRGADVRARAVGARGQRTSPTRAAHPPTVISKLVAPSAVPPCPRLRSLRHPRRGQPTVSESPDPNPGRAGHGRLTGRCIGSRCRADRAGSFSTGCRSPAGRTAAEAEAPSSEARSLRRRSLRHRSLRRRSLGPGRTVVGRYGGTGASREETQADEDHAKQRKREPETRPSRTRRLTPRQRESLSKRYRRIRMRGPTLKWQPMTPKHQPPTRPTG